MNTTAKAVLFSLFSMVMFNAQANENQHNGGGDPRFVCDCAAYEDSEG